MCVCVCGYVAFKVTLDFTDLAAQAESLPDKGAVGSWGSAIHRLYPDGCVALLAAVWISFWSCHSGCHSTTLIFTLQMEFFWHLNLFFFFLAAVIMHQLFSECQEDVRAPVLADISQCVCALEMKAFAEQRWVRHSLHKYL